MKVLMKVFLLITNLGILVFILPKLLEALGKIFPDNLSTSNSLLQKKKIPSNGDRISIVALLLVIVFLVCIITADFDRSPGMGNAISRVYKSEIPVGTSKEEIAQILVHRMMDKYKIGTRGWKEWVWAYKVKEIRLGDNGSAIVVIYVKPLIPNSWANFWTFEVEWVDNEWVRVGYMMVIDNKREYYELRGPFSGG